MNVAPVRGPLWASPTLSEADEVFPDPVSSPSEPICCWNICPAQFTAKEPRAAKKKTAGVIGSSKNINLGMMGSALVLPPDAFSQISRRLFVETVAPGQHLLFSPLTGAVDWVNDAGLARLRHGQAGRVDWLPSEARDLHARGYLFGSSAQEEEFLEQSVTSAWNRMRTRQPAMYTVCPTLACNLACAYCFEGDSLTQKKQGVMTDAQVDQLFAAIEQLRQENPDEAEGAPWIGLFGGEPLLPSTRRCVARILARAAEGGFLVGTITNGVNLVRYEDLLREYADILTVFQVTLDGPAAVHDRRRHRLGGQGTFAEIVRGVDLLLSLGIDVDLRVNVDKENLSSLPDLAAFLDEQGWTSHPGFHLALAPVTDHSSANPLPEGAGCGGKQSSVLSEMEMARGVLALMEQHPRLAEVCHLGFLRHLDFLVSVLEPEKHSSRRGGSPGPRYWYCEASTDKQFVFTPEGLIYSCTEAVGKPSHAIGRFDPALDLWRPQTKQWQGRTILSHPKCRSCAISTLCGGGCNFAAREQGTAGALMQIGLPGGRTTGTKRSVEPFCNAAEETVRAYLRYAGPRVLSRPALLSDLPQDCLPLSRQAASLPNLASRLDPNSLTSKCA